MLIFSCCCLCLHSDTDALAATWLSSLSPLSPGHSNAVWSWATILTFHLHLFSTCCAPNWFYFSPSRSSAKWRKKKSVHYLRHVQCDSSSSLHFSDSWDCIQSSVAVKGNSLHMDKNLWLRSRTLKQFSCVKHLMTGKHDGQTTFFHLYLPLVWHRLCQDEWKDSHGCQLAGDQVLDDCLEGLGKKHLCTTCI